MTLAQDFAVALRRSPTRPAAPVGDRVAAAVAEVLGVDGVGLAASYRSGTVVPIGASNAAAVLTEQLEFTTGQGPCVDAHRDGRVVVATGSALAQRWPAFHDVLVVRTPFRSMVAAPLAGPLSTLITIGLLLRNADDAADIPPQAVTSLCLEVTAALIEADLQAQDDAAAESSNSTVTTPPDFGRGGPVWLSGPGSAARQQVMVAAGMISWLLHVPVGDAVKVLKSRAYAQHSTADDLAAAIVAGTVPTATFADD